jgi:hypothetical protein
VVVVSVVVSTDPLVAEAVDQIAVAVEGMIRHQLVQIRR